MGIQDSILATLYTGNRFFLKNAPVSYKIKELNEALWSISTKNGETTWYVLSQRENFRGFFQCFGTLGTLQSLSPP